MPPTVLLRDVALFFDVDGTLVSIENEPSAVNVSKALLTQMQRLAEATDGAVALVSGRSIEQLDALFQPLLFSASGLHGLECRLLPGSVVSAKTDSKFLSSARTELEAFAQGRDGIFFEDKGLTLALHYRMAPDQHEAAAQVVRNVVDKSQGNLVLLEGKKVFELKPPGFDKGKAIADFMKEPPFKGRRPIFAGDDVTDEAGFTVVNSLKGLSIKVGADEGATEARNRVDHVQAMLAWLDDLLDHRDAQGGERS
ncbi:MAG: trehalose-phosphatase [Geminicoccales bacterium]